MSRANTHPENSAKRGRPLFPLFTIPENLRHALHCAADIGKDGDAAVPGLGQDLEGQVPLA